MASGKSGSKGGFDLGATDDILCSYDDYNNNAHLADSAIADSSTSTKEFHKTRMARTPTFPSSTYISPEEYSNKDIIPSVERTMKKYTDNIVRFLEGISSRLSQLELYCYNLDKSIGEMRSDLVRGHEEADIKLKSLDRHLQEVHRSVQILRDKQELADTHKELAKLQLAQKEPSSDKTTPESSSDTTTNTDNTPDPRSQQLALALPHQIAPQSHQQPITPPQPQGVAPPQSYYVQPSQIQNLPQGQYVASDSPYRTQQAPPQPNQSPQLHPLPHYQQQWPQQAPTQSPSMQPQVRPSASAAYPSYLPPQPANFAQPETIPSSMPVQGPYSGNPQPGGSRVEASPYGYGGTPRPVQQQPPPQHLKSQYGIQNDGYTPSGPHPSLSSSNHHPPSSSNAYMIYQNEGGRAHHPHQPHYAEGTYPPPSFPFQGPPSNASSVMSRPPQFARGHPYNELIDKLVGMGYRSDHVASVIQRLEESGQSVDFNAVLDVLNGHPSGGSQRGWSG